ncbi:MAG: ribose 5-phosphate isomerase B [Bacillota bacterium]
MKIALGFDHGGFEHKKTLIDYLEKNKIEYVDFGTNSSESCDYPIFAEKVAKAVQCGECERGILICGTGVGMSIVANKFKGIRCALCNEYFMAKATREHNDSNVLAMGARVIGLNVMLEIVDVWIKTEFIGIHHTKRIQMISDIENA